MSSKDNNFILTFEDIKGPDLIEHTNKIITINSGETISFHIDKKHGLQSLDRYYINSGVSYKESKFITIDSRIHTIEEQTFIRSMFTMLDLEIDLDFIEMSTNNGSDIDIYKVNSSSSFESNTIGQAIKQDHQAGSWWDVLWKDTNGINNLESLEKNTIIHEIGHVLGLAHPFNDPFNKNFTTKDTVMSYNMGPNGWDEWFSITDIQALKSIWGREDDSGSMKFDKKSKNYNFKYDVNESLFINSEIGYEPINNVENLIFDDRVLNVKKDIESVFNELVSIDHITGKIYRLYNAAFGRFPDIDGFKYWIKKNISNENSYYQTVESFIHSDEFIHLYFTTDSEKEYLSSLYNNVFNREPDINGYNYWLNQLESNNESKSDVLIGFSESIENKEIFATQTSILA